MVGTTDSAAVRLDEEKVENRLPVTVLSGFLGELIIQNKPLESVEKITKKLGF